MAISENKVVSSMKQFTKPGKELPSELPVECFPPYGNSSIPTLLPIGNHLLYISSELLALTIGQDIDESDLQVNIPSCNNNSKKVVSNIYHKT